MRKCNGRQMVDGVKHVHVNLPCANFGVWAGHTAKGCKGCNAYILESMHRRVLEPRRKETAASVERGALQLDDLLDSSGLWKLREGVWTSDDIRGIGPSATVLICATGRVRDDVRDWAEAEPLIWTELEGTFMERGADGSSSPVLRRLVNGKYVEIPKSVLQRHGKLILAVMGHRMEQVTGSAKDNACEGLFVADVVGLELASGSVINKSPDSRGVKVLDGDGHPISGRWGMVAFYVIPNGWDHAGDPGEPFVLMSGADVFETRETASKHVFRGPKVGGLGSGAGAGVSASASAGGAAAGALVAASGPYGRSGNESNEEFFNRAVLTYDAWAPIARGRLLPRVPPSLTGLRALAVRGDVEFILNPDVKLWRALNFGEEAAAVRVSRAADPVAPLPALFGRALELSVPPRSADEWARVIVRHVEHGSRERGPFVSWTGGVSSRVAHASSSIAARLSEKAIEGGTPSRIVVWATAASLLSGGGVLVRVHDSDLLKRAASARSVSYASALHEVLLVSPQAVGGYQLSVLDGEVVGYMGPPSQETEWDGVIGAGTVVCGTGTGTSPSGVQLEMLKLLGGHFSPTTTKKMTLLVSLLEGVEGTGKSKDAVKRKLPIVSIARFYSRLEVLFQESGLSLGGGAGAGASGVGGASSRKVPTKSLRKVPTKQSKARPTAAAGSSGGASSAPSLRKTPTKRSKASAASAAVSSVDTSSVPVPALKSSKKRSSVESTRTATPFVEVEEEGAVSAVAAAEAARSVIEEASLSPKFDEPVEGFGGGGGGGGAGAKRSRK